MQVSSGSFDSHLVILDASLFLKCSIRTSAESSLSEWFDKISCIKLALLKVLSSQLYW